MKFGGGWMRGGWWGLCVGVPYVPRWWLGYWLHAKDYAEGGPGSPASRVAPSGSSLGLPSNQSKCNCLFLASVKGRGGIHRNRDMLAGFVWIDWRLSCLIWTRRHRQKQLRRPPEDSIEIDNLISMRFAWLIDIYTLGLFLNKI